MAGMPEYVALDGPSPTTNRWGDEIPEWYVTTFGPDDVELKARVFTHMADARSCAERLSEQYGIELVDETSPL